MAILKLKCPTCGAEIKPDEALRASAAWECLELIARFGKAAPLIREYVYLFKLPQRGLPFERAARLLAELSALWEDGYYQWNGVTYKAEKSVVVEALQQVVNSPTLRPPLKNNNYLKQVLHPLSQKDAGKREREAEEKKKSRKREVSGPEVVDVNAVPKHIGELIQAGKITEAVAEMAKERKADGTD